MKMKKKHIGAVVAIAAIALVGFILFPLVAAWSIALFPVTADSAVPLVRMVILHHVIPGIAMGIILGLAAVLLCPVRHLTVLMLPTIFVFIAYLVLQTLLPMTWNTRYILTFVLPGWIAMFIGAAGVVVIGRNLRVSNHASEAIAPQGGAQPQR